MDRAEMRQRMQADRQRMIESRELDARAKALMDSQEALSSRERARAAEQIAKAKAQAAQAAEAAQVKTLVRNLEGLLKKQFGEVDRKREEYKRLEKLFQQGAVPAESVDESKAKLEVAKADLLELQAQMKARESAAAKKQAGGN